MTAILSVAVPTSPMEIAIATEILDECDICGGEGIPVGDCDCNGNALDALGECGGPGDADADADGICDDIDPCVGALDACECAMGQGPFTSVGARTSLKVIATEETSSTCVGLASSGQMWTVTDFATMTTTAQTRCVQFRDGFSH